MDPQVELESTDAELSNKCWPAISFRRSETLSPSPSHRRYRQLASYRVSELVPAVEADAVLESNNHELFRAERDTGTPLEQDRYVRVIRPVSKQSEFDERHGGHLVRKPLLHQLRDGFRSVASKPPDRAQVCSVVFHVLPFLAIMRQYNFREWLFSDFMSGLTVCVMHIPQSIAFAFVAELPPYIGLYTSFFPPIVYFFFGTSRQLSIGTHAVGSLLMGGLMAKHLDPGLATNRTLAEAALNATMPSAGQSFLDEDPMVRSRVTLACAVCLVVGLIQLLMGVLGLGFLTRYLSDPLLSGFTMGISINVISGQIKHVLGINVKNRSGIGSLPLHYLDLARNIQKTNFVSLAIAAVSIVLLFVAKVFVNPRVRKKLKAPLPTELMIIILGTLVSFAFDLSGKHSVKIVGKFPTGIPAPEVPDFSVLNTSMAMEIFTLAIIIYTISVSVAKIFAKKNNYEIGASQELIAYGMSSTIGAFFHCWPAGASLVRSAVQDSMGGRTQVSGLVSSTLLLMVLLFIGKYFEKVPNCSLAAIVIVAMVGVMDQIKEVPMLWRLSPYDFWTWTVTCLGVVLLSMDYGLVLGLVFSVCTIIIRTQSPTSAVLGRISDTDLYKNVLAYEDVREVDGIKIFRYEGSLYFASAENFRETLYRKTGVNPRETAQKRKRVEEKYAKKMMTSQSASSRPNFPAMPDSEKTEAARAVGLEWPQVRIRHVILDASTWGYIDFAGIRSLNQAIQEYKKIGVAVLIANPKCEIRAALNRSDFYEMNQSDIIYVTVHDAVLAAQFDRLE